MEVVYMRTVSLSEVQEELQSHILRKELFPIIGSGFTRGAQTSSGETVPSGSDMTNYMEQYLKDNGYSNLPRHEFSHVARYFQRVASQEDFWRYFQNNFLGVKLPSIKKDFLNCDWRFIYTLNLDDAIENNSSYTTKVTPGYTPRWDALNNSKCVIKLHGDAQELVNYIDSPHVLALSEYVISIERNKPLLDKLAEDLNYSNTIFIGCSLTDELDLLSVSQQLKVKINSKKNRYFVTDTKPDPFQVIDLEDYGIDTVILVSDYEEFYVEFIKLAKSASSVRIDQLEEFHNLYRGELPSQKNVDYLLRGRYLLDKKKRTIFYPQFFIERDLSQQLLNEMDTIRIQIIHGGRISGKSYLLAGLLRNIINRDTYYFDSRNTIDDSFLKLLLKQNSCVLLFDTNVLSKNAMKYLLDLPTQFFLQHNINVICCANNSDRDIFSIISYVQQYSPLDTKHIKTYELDKRFSIQKGGELDQLNAKLKANKITPFVNKLSILDNLLQIKKDMPKKSSFKNIRFDSPPSISADDSGKIALLILLVQNEKVSARQIIQCQLIKESAALLEELKLTIEEDHRNQLQLTTYDSASYQVVSNATFWLLSQLHTLSQDRSLRETIVEAFQLLIHSFLGHTKNYKNIENLVKFDKLNEIFPDGKGLILHIYDNIRPMLMESYQYFHQAAKCRLWGLNTPGYDKSELDQAKIDAITAYKIAMDTHEQNPTVISHRVALAHILFTLTVIHTKSCIEEDFGDADTFCATFDFFSKATKYGENYEAMKQAKDNKTRGDESSIIHEWINLMLQGKSQIPPNCQRKWATIIQYWQAL